MKKAAYIMALIILGMLLAELKNIRSAIEEHPSITIQGANVQVVEPANNNIAITESEVSL